LLVVLFKGLYFYFFPCIWFCRIKVKKLHTTRIES
jgi:hypothetical protein